MERPNRGGWARKCLNGCCRLRDLCDLVGLRSLLPLNNLELNRIAFLQGLKALTLDGRVMNENISSAVLADEAISLAIVEPLYLSLKSCHLHPPSFVFAIAAQLMHPKMEIAENPTGPRLHLMRTYLADTSLTP